MLRGKAAADLLIMDALTARRNKRFKGIVADAMVDPDGEAVSFRWGNPGRVEDEFSGGSGISKVLAKHGPEALQDSLEVIARGKVVERGDFRTVTEFKKLELGNNRVILQRFKNQDELRRVGPEKEGTWFMTGYEKDGANVQVNLQAISGPLFFEQ